MWKISPDLVIFNFLNASPGQLSRYVQVELNDRFTDYLKANPNQTFLMKIGLHPSFGVQHATKGNMNYGILDDQANNRLFCVGLLTYLNHHNVSKLRLLIWEF